MKAGLDEERLRLIWQYDIEPFIEDQFFGDPAQIDFFRFDTVMRRYQSQSGLGELTLLVEGAETVDGPAAGTGAVPPEAPPSSPDDTT
jgi:hypothetical protein